MKSVITDPEAIERKLVDAGFSVLPQGMAFEVSLTNRKVQRSEVATVLECEPEDLSVTAQGVLVR